MTARHRSNPTPDQARLRMVVLLMLVVLVVGIVFFRNGGSEGPDDTVSAGSTTTTSPASTLTTGGSVTTTDPGAGLAPLQGVELELVYDGFRQPIALTAPAGDDRLFVAQRVGVIRILDESRQLLDPAFLDLTDRVLAGGIEQGLLGLAFHPDYADNRRFFVYYTDKEGNRQLSEFTATATDPSRADPASERVLFEFEQPPDATDIRHYAGNLAFDEDGLLWISSGDGADSRAQAQDPNTPYGKILRIDVDGGDPYGIPADNPFVAGGGMPEVWAYGLRNPWRFSIDPVDRMVYIGDVGHGDQEEIDVVSVDTGGGSNFGWSNMEGTRCFHEPECDPADYTAPVITYLHASEEENAVTGISVTGGFVYRGSEIPELAGTYFYSDWLGLPPDGTWIRSFRFVDGQATEQRDWTEDLGPIGQVNSFGLDGHGELYVLTHGGQVYKFTAVR
ncbi:MAG: PQQ-dependent sugar dehydrogenase [Actinobacteria bacterium]|nr:PQQ-dependent sugar dehydrogenase [Actinomycetota bacterium]MCI0679567.1 PQQ-dependent sugar dehydrogenase [Actinomycetota bacterium]